MAGRRGWCVLGIALLGAALGNVAQQELRLTADEPARAAQPPQSEPGRGPDGPFRPPLFRLPVLEALDTNHDGELTEDELSNAPAALKTLDQDRDGQLQFEELIPDPGVFPPGPEGFGGPGGPFGGPGGPGGFGGPGGPMGGGERKLVEEFDKDLDGRLNTKERQAARDAAGRSSPDRFRGGPGGFGGPGGPGGPGGRGSRFGGEPPASGMKLSPQDVESFPGRDLYDASVLRTLFIDFENEDWEAELAAFNNTDVEVPATLTVDGNKYPNVGVHFRGMSSYMMVPAGYKRSLNLSLDFADRKQRLYGHRTLNLLNAHEDPSFLSSVLYSHIARQYIPAPRANMVRVVINGEDWGVYPNVQQFNSDFLQENFSTSAGTRWKVSGSPGADGGLRYLGEDLNEYRRRYDIKSGDNDEAWQALVHLCRVLDQTPVEQLEQALTPLVDLDGLLWFLALDVALINNDGYWVRASDYSIYRDESGTFHFIPHDMNEAFHGAMGGPGGRGGRGGPGGGGFGGGGFGGGGFGGGPRGERPVAEADNRQTDAGQAPGDGVVPPGRVGRSGGGFGGPGFGGPGFGGPGFGGPGFGGPESGGGVSLDPLIGLDNVRTPLRSKVLAVPALRERYLQCVKTIAEESLDWNAIGPVVRQYRELVKDEIEQDTRKLSSSEEFLAATSDAADAGEPRGRHLSLRSFMDQRRQFLLAHAGVAAVSTIRPADRVRPRTPDRPVASVTGHSLVRLNEVMASNERTLADPQGEFDDWIELHNQGTEPVDLSGMYLTDASDMPKKWSIPVGTIVPAGGFLVLWADEDGKAAGGLHMNFKLSASGEEVLLVDRDGATVLDRVEFAKQTTDVSWGRFPDASGQWQSLFATPGSANRDHEK